MRRNMYSYAAAGDVRHELTITTQGPGSGVVDAARASCSCGWRLAAQGRRAAYEVRRAWSEHIQREAGLEGLKG